MFVGVLIFSRSFGLSGSWKVFGTNYNSRKLLMGGKSESHNVICSSRVAMRLMLAVYLMWNQVHIFMFICNLKINVVRLGTCYRWSGFCLKLW